MLIGADFKIRVSKPKSDLKFLLYEYDEKTPLNIFKTFREYSTTVDVVYEIIKLSHSVTVII